MLERSVCLQYLLMIAALILMISSLIIYISGFFMKNVKEDKKNKRRYLAIGIFVLSLLLFMIGDKVRINMMKNEVVKYYEKEIPYKEMNNLQKQNITSIFMLEKIPKDKRDRYLPAFKYYLEEYYSSQGKEDHIEKSIKIFIDDKKDLED